jgi:nitronate monooxygenase
MAGGPGTPELAAAVSNAGGLGSLGAAYLCPEEILQSIRHTQALTSGPFAVNLFAGGYPADAKADPAPMVELLSAIHKALGLPPPVIPLLPPDPFREQLEAVLEARPAVFSFTFGIPGRDVFSLLRSRGIAILGTATTAGEARLLMEAGVDAVVAQGAEAGAHRGTFAVPFEAAMVPTLHLVRAIAAFAPVVASGGIMDGRDVATMLAHGAIAAQLGTAFLTCPESGASPPYKRALLRAASNRAARDRTSSGRAASDRDSSDTAATDRTASDRAASDHASCGRAASDQAASDRTCGATVITRAFSGRPARGLANAFTALLAGNESAILPYPLQNALTRPMRAAAAAQGNAEFLSLWAGQGVARSRQMPAGELAAKLVEEIEAGGGPIWGDKPARNSTA